MHVPKLYGLFLAFTLAFSILACENNQSNTAKIKKAVENDSVKSWLDKKTAPTHSAYRKNLRKALSAIALEKDDTLKSKNSLELSYKYLKLDDSLNFRKANQMAQSSAKKINSLSNLAGAYWDAGAFFRDRNVPDSSYYNYAKAHKIYEQLDSVYITGRMLHDMASNLATIKDFTTAETYVVQAIKLIDSTENTKKISRLYKSYNLLGMIFNNLKEYDKALESHNKALKFLELMDEKGTSLSRSQNNIGAVYRDQGNYKSALNAFTKASQMDSLYFKDPQLYAKALSNYAYSQFKLGDTTNVLAQFNKAIAIKDSIGDTKALSRSYYTMSEFLFATKDTTAALNFAKKAIQTSQAIDNNLRVLETLGLLSKIDPENSAEYFDQFRLLNNNLQIVERRSRNKFERIRFETNETLAENVLLARQKQLWTGIAGIALLLAIATYIIIDQRRKNEKLRFQEGQRESNQRIFDLLLAEKSKIEEGKKLAQKRISEELHDGVQGRMQGIRMLLLGLNKRNTTEAIEERAEAIKELKSVQEEVRAISHELSHAAYQRIYSFITTVQELLNEAKKNAALQTKFVFDETIDWDTLESDIKINVYRIIQESIQNCVKYAEAELAVVTFDLSDSKILKVTIADNGKGFQLKNRKKGIGMRNINSRVEKLGGKWEIQSEIKEGTKVILYIPTSISENTIS